MNCSHPTPPMSKVAIKYHEVPRGDFRIECVAVVVWHYANDNNDWLTGCLSDHTNAARTSSQYIEHCVPR